MVTEARPRPALIEELDVLNEANECIIDRPIDTQPLSAEHAFAFWQKDIPEVYWDLDGDQLRDRIAISRAKLGTRAVVLGHHYQREDIV
ncbi:MAG: hypothetical protein ABIP58_04135, partial [Dehalococcoidia bacterium]